MKVLDSDYLALKQKEVLAMTAMGGRCLGKKMNLYFTFVVTFQIKKDNIKRKPLVKVRMILLVFALNFVFTWVIPNPGVCGCVTSENQA